VLGSLFPTELQSGVTITRLPSTGAAGTADYFQFSVLQSQDYLINLLWSNGLPVNALPVLWSNGAAASSLPQSPGAALIHLNPGTYLVSVSWGGGDPAVVSYQMQIAILESIEVGTALTTGPAPLLGVRLVTLPPEAVNPPAGPAPPPGLGGAVVPSRPQPAPPPASLPPAGVFVALADNPLGPVSAGVLGGNPDATRVSRVDTPGLNPQLAYSLAVLSIQTISGVGGTNELDAPAPERSPSATVAMSVEDVWNQVASLISSNGCAGPLRGAAEVVEGIARIMASLPARWDEVSLAAVPAPACLEPAEQAGALAPAPGGDEANEPSTTALPASRLSPWRLPPALIWTVAACTLLLGLVRGKRLARGFGRRAQPAPIPAKAVSYEVP
jgi:hypothetical protein